MEIEGFILFFCFMYCGFLGGSPGQSVKSDPRPAWAMPALLIVGFGFGGILAEKFGGTGLVVIFALSLLMHMINMFRLQRHELQREAGASFLAILGFIAVGFLAWLLPLPRFGNAYPPVFEDHWAFRIGGHQMLAWACAHFALLGFLQLRKHRIFAHLRAEPGGGPPGQTPR